mgnify:CR=1 FL=1
MADGASLDEGWRVHRDRDRDRGGLTLENQPILATCARFVSGFVQVKSLPMRAVSTSGPQQLWVGGWVGVEDGWWGWMLGGCTGG